MPRHLGSLPLQVPVGFTVMFHCHLDAALMCSSITQVDNDIQNRCLPKVNPLLHCRSIIDLLSSDSRILQIPEDVQCLRGPYTLISSI
jgi:hypothetical protein